MFGVALAVSGKLTGRDFFDGPALSAFASVSKPFAEGDEVASVPGW